MTNNNHKRRANPLIKQILNKTPREEKKRVEKKMLLAARIDDLIQSKGWTKSQFAEKINRKPSEITKWLSGMHNFTIDTLTDISLIFNISLSELLSFRKDNILRQKTITVRGTATMPLLNFNTPYIKESTINRTQLSGTTNITYSPSTLCQA